MDLELDEDRSRPTKMSRTEIETSKEKLKKEMEEIKILVQEFLAAPSPVVDGSLKAKGGDIGVVDWWLKHLGVGWVLDMADDASAGILLDDNQAWCWIRALAKITHTICFMDSLCRGGHDSVGNKDSIPDPFQSAQFIQKTMLKMLVFVDAIVAPNAKTTLQEQEVTVMNPRLLQQCGKLSTLLGVHGALSEALSSIRWLVLLCPWSSRVAERIYENMVSILSAKEAKAAEAVWSIMEQMRMEWSL